MNRFVMYLCYLFKINRFSLKNLFEKAHFIEDLTLASSLERKHRSLDLFRFQAEHNGLYRDYIRQLSVSAEKVDQITSIPFLPISFFKTHQLATGSFEPETCFESSGTTGTVSSRHCIKSLRHYLDNTVANFHQFYGDPADYCFLALLPSYLERGNSSLVAMTDHFIKLGNHEEAGFFLHNLSDLRDRLSQLEERGQKAILLGVTYALLDFAEQFPMQLKNTIVMETGGMKGRKKEITREALHAELMNGLGVEVVHAEYGMTELQSQAYSGGKGLFKPSDTMIVLLRSPDDPFEVWESHEYPMRMGVINIIDLANRDTMAFIATDDLGRFHEDGHFEILGRVDHADIRGCSLLVV
jgi:hypothetical protein